MAYFVAMYALPFLKLLITSDRTNQSVFEYAEFIGFGNFYFWKAAHERYARVRTFRLNDERASRKKCVKHFDGFCFCFAGGL